MIESALNRWEDCSTLFSAFSNKSLLALFISAFLLSLAREVSI
jgi:hypothetical protein